MLENLLKTDDNLNKNEILELLNDPNIYNQNKFIELILKNLKKINNLEDNDPNYLELVELMYEGRKNSLLSNNKNNRNAYKTFSDLLKNELDFKSQNLKDLEKIDYLNPPQLESFENVKTNNIGNSLLNIISNHDLKEIGITPSFVNALKK